MRALPHVPTFQNTYKSYRLGESRNVRAKIRCRVVHIQFVQYKNHYAYGMSPLFTKTNVCVCVCVCVCVRVCVLLTFQKFH